MSDARHALVGEMVRVLVADAGLGGLIGGRVFDGVPQGAVHPFVALGEVLSMALDGDAVPAVEHRVEVDVFSRATRAEASDVAERARAVLEGVALEPDGHRVVALRHHETAVTAGKDGRSYRARAKFRAVTEAV